MVSSATDHREEVDIKKRLEFLQVAFEMAERSASCGTARCCASSMAHYRELIRLFDTLFVLLYGFIDEKHHRIHPKCDK